MAFPSYSDEEIKEALRISGGNMSAAARTVGCSPLTIRNRAMAFGFPRNTTRGRTIRVVSDEQLVEALEMSSDLFSAAKALGVQRNTILSRLRERGVEREIERLEKRRAAIREKLCATEDHTNTIAEAALEWAGIRQEFIIRFRDRLSLKEIGNILGVSRERVRQLETEAVAATAQKAAE
jgi:DNA-directed RNA polymerase specialized sigma subunit